MTQLKQRARHRSRRKKVVGMTALQWIQQQRQLNKVLLPFIQLQLNILPLCCSVFAALPTSDSTYLPICRWLCVCSSLCLSPSFLPFFLSFFLSFVLSFSPFLPSFFPILSCIFLGFLFISHLIFVISLPAHEFRIYCQNDTCFMVWIKNTPVQHFFII